MHRACGIVASLAFFAPAASALGSPPRAAVAVRGMPPKSQAADALRQRVRAALAKEADLLEPAREAFLFATPPPPSSKRALARAAAALDRASRRLAEFDVLGAERAVARATELLKPFVGLRAAREVDHQRLEVSVAIAHARRDENALTDLLREYATRYPAGPEKTSPWPPDVLRRLEDLALPEQAGLRVRSTPAARVYVNGLEVGETPLDLSTLTPGAHRVEIDAAGYHPHDVWVTTASGDVRTVEAELAPAIARRLARLGADKPIPHELTSQLAEILRAADIDRLYIAGRVAEERLTMVRIDGEAVKATATCDDTPEGLAICISQLSDVVAKEPPAIAANGDRRGVPAWAWLTGGAGLAAAGAGVALRLLAVDTQSDFNARDGALTQRQAFDFRDRADLEATSGSILLGAGIAAVVSTAGWVAFELLGERSEP